jgi:heptosyltransferase II
LRGDLEAFLIGAKLRIGMVREYWRPLLNAIWKVPKKADSWHQTKIWGGLVRHFGLRELIDFSPLNDQSKRAKHNKQTICFAPGSSNTPEKRWPVENWIELINIMVEKHPACNFKLIGTSKDSEICREIEKNLNSREIENCSGKTSIIQLCELFHKSHCLVCNDSGAMHLANALGVPVFAVFMSTRPTVTGPIFESFKKILEDEDPDLIAQELRDCIND